VGKRIGEDGRWIEWRDAGIDIGRGGGGGVDKEGGKRIVTEAADVQSTGVIKKEKRKYKYNVSAEIFCWWKICAMFFEVEAFRRLNFPPQK
jgi:hypothetical protein